MASLYSPPLYFPVTGRTDYPNSSFIHLFRNHNSKVAKPSQYYISRVTCESNPKPNISIGMFDRRNVNILLRVAQQRFGVCAAQAAETPNNNVNFPLILDSIVSVVVERPKKSRSKKEPAKKELLIEGIELYKNEENLVIEGIEFDRNTLIKFDVLVNAEDCPHLIEANHAEYAGTFFNVPHTPHPGCGNTRTNLVLSFTNFLIDLEAENDDSVVVTLVPRCGKVTINNVKIVSVSDW